MTKADLLKYIDERLTQRSDGNIGLLMVRQYVEDNMEDYHTQNLKAYAHDFDCSIEEAEEALRKEQPSQKNESNTLEALDCVSRKKAIDAVCIEWCNVKHQDCKHPFDVEKDDYYWCDGCETVLRTLPDLPSVQPEIIRCKDCMHYKFEIDMCIRQGATICPMNVVHEDDFCSYAERRKDA